MRRFISAAFLSQELGKVLQKIMLATPADLSTLTGELREMVEKILNS
jgi:hypothetical protein